MSTEIWKAIPGFGGHYEASTLGRIRSKDRVILKRDRHSGALMKQIYKGRVLRCSKGGNIDHLYAHLGVDGKKIRIAAHRLVLFAFKGAPEDGQEACHNNGIAQDNRPENLRWDTHYENNQDRRAHGTYPSGDEHHMAKFDEAVIREIYERQITAKEAMKKYGISLTHVYRVRAGDTWKKQLGGYQ